MMSVSEVKHTVVPTRGHAEDHRASVTRPSYVDGFWSAIDQMPRSRTRDGQSVIPTTHLTLPLGQTVP